MSGTIHLVPFILAGAATFCHTGERKTTRCGILMEQKSVPVRLAGIIGQKRLKRVTRRPLSTSMIPQRITASPAGRIEQR
jgi:hypothetical protein